MNIRPVALVALLGLSLSACSSRRFSAGLGAYSGGLKSTSADETGAKGLFAPFVFPIGVKGAFGSGSMPVIVAFDYSLIGRSSPESSVKSTYILTRVLLGLEPAKGSRFAFAFGPSVVSHRQVGDGVPVTLNNGTGTSVFGTPGRASTSHVVALNAVVDIRFDRWVFSNELFWKDFLNSSRWNLGILWSLHYQFGGK